MSIRELSGMTYNSIELEHEVGVSASDVLRKLAEWLDLNGENHSILVDLNTQLSPFDEDKFITTLIFAP